MEYEPNDPKSWTDIPDIDECPRCEGEGVVWDLKPDPQDDIEVPCPLCQPKPDACGRCGGTGYIRALRPGKFMCPDCWQDNGMDEPTGRESASHG